MGEIIFFQKKQYCRSSKLLYLLVIIFIFILLPLKCLAADIEDPDQDKDGLSDKIEISLGTDPNNPDTDGDGFSDGVEVYSGFNPLKGGGDRTVDRRVEVSLNYQQLYYYFNNVLLGQMAVSTGVTSRGVTPTGTFEILRKLPAIEYKGPGYDYKNTKWNLEFKKSFFLHGAYWHNQFGIRPMSHGCVNIAYKDVEKLYKFMDIGDKVIIYGETPVRVK